MTYSSRDFSQQSKSDSSYLRHLGRLWQQAHDGGIGYELVVLRREQMASVIRAHPDNDTVRSFFLTMRSWFAHVGVGGRPLCLCCEFEFLPDNVAENLGAFALLRPVHAAPSSAGSGICRSCCAARSDAELVAAAKAFAVGAGLADPSRMAMKVGTA
jgi:hypothetical protein